MKVSKLRPVDLTEALFIIQKFNELCLDECEKEEKASGLRTRRIRSCYEYMEWAEDAYEQAQQIIKAAKLLKKLCSTDSCLTMRPRIT